MEVNLSNTDALFIYGHFRKEAHKLEALKAMPDCPVSKENLDQDIQLYNSIADKFRDAYPELSGLDNYRI